MTVELVVGDAVVGSKTLHVVVPNGLAFENDTMNAIYGVEVTLPLTATYNGNPVSINADDVNFTFSSDAGTMNGFAFIGNEESGVRNVTITAALAKDLSVSDTIALSPVSYTHLAAIRCLSLTTSAWSAAPSTGWNRFSM